MFKTKTLLVIIVVLFSGILFFGNLEVRNYSLNHELKWTENDISWVNFTRIDKLSDDYVASIDSRIYCPEDIPDSDFKIFAYMIPSKSFKLHDSMLSDHTLKHEQYHFNITEYHARLLRKAIINVGRDNLTPRIYDSLFNTYNDQKNLMQFNYDSITDHSVNEEDQRFWELKLDELFRDTEYYKDENLDHYHRFNSVETDFFKEFYLTFDHNILTSYPLSKYESKFGNVYKVITKENEKWIHFYKNGELTNGGSFKTAITQIKSNNNSIEVRYYNKDKNLNQALDYNYYRLSKNEDGWVKEFYNSKDERVTNKGIFQINIKKLNNSNFEYSYYNNLMQPIKNKKGVYKSRITIDSLGRTIQVEGYSVNNKPILNKDFVWKTKREFDNNHETIKYQEYDIDGSFALHSIYYNLIYEDDERGNLKTEYVLDENSNISANADGIAIYSYRHNLNDEIISIRRFNSEKSPVNGVENFHKVIYKYNEKGQKIYSAKFYPGNVLVFDEDKWGASIYEYQSDSIKYTKNIDAYNNLINSNTGVAYLKEYLNDKGLVTKSIYYDENNNFAKKSDGIVQYETKYDDNGNKIEEISLDSLGNISPFEADVAIVRWEYDKNDNKVKTTYFNKSGELANANQNTTYNIFEYNKKGELIERRNYDKNMEPIAFNGSYKSIIISNKLGKDSIILNYDVNNKPLESVYKTVYEYNAYGNLILKAFYDSQNQPIKNINGVAAIKSLYNSKQQFIGENYLDEYGNLINNSSGIAYNHQVLNDYGYIISDYYFDNNHKAVMGPEGYHKLEQLWDDKGELINYKLIGLNGNLINDEFGVSEYKYIRDNTSLISIVKRFDTNGRPTNNTNGVAETYYKRYLNGLYFLDYELDASGNKIIEDSTDSTVE